MHAGGRVHAPELCVKQLLQVDLVAPNVRCHLHPVWSAQDFASNSACRRRTPQRTNTAYSATDNARTRVDRSAERNRQAIGRGRRLRRQLVPLRLVRSTAAPAAPLAWHVAGTPSTTQHNVQWAYNTTLAHVLVTQAHLAQPVLGKLPPALRVVDLLGLTR
jgi:hypothetical protein